MFNRFKPKEANLELYPCIGIYAISRDVSLLYTFHPEEKQTVYLLKNALPDRRLFAKVWPRTKTPVYAVILTVVIVTLLGLLSLASFIAVSRI